jgi:type I restriction-modification system DNA methylase subunit
MCSTEVQSDIFGDFGRMVNNTIINSYLFVSLELSGKAYTRTELATITREINRCFAMPVLVLFKYNMLLTLSVINRRLHKIDSNKDVLEKVTLIKDICYLKPHRAHIETLALLSFTQLTNKVRIDSFVKLHNTWQKVLDIKEINDRFFREIRNWFLWSLKHIRFPQIRPADEMEEAKEYQSKSIIRFITRFMFCWFLKEKKDIIPSDFFNQEKLSALLKNFDPKASKSDYYHAILQNLFFATLSVPQAERRIIDQTAYPNSNPDYGKPFVFRYHECFENEEVIKTMFQAIPFLNGGLFDCLDRRKDHNQDIEIRLDGFSTKQSKQAVFPNYLFWGTHSVDLSDELNTAKAKQTKVLGIIELFEQYVFTVEESTPIEEEIALDPELLGRVFENILAFINPETHETTRKGTGSFYTPRKVVDYMVDASLKEHLSQELKNHLKMTEADIDTGLSILFEYSEKEHAFNNREAQCIVQAIDDCKVIDPACGSGAFLMGILHRMTHLLSKIDKDNSIWFEKLIERFPAHLQEQMKNQLERESLTYTRKLGLIQNCIYGVDIQPIAVQIAKLRFFLTLIIEQDIDLTKDNYGIIPLPNLEFKLVCADTIATLSDEDTKEDKDYDEFLENPYTTSLEKEVHKYFAVNLPGEKLKIKSTILKIIRTYVQPHLKNISTLQSSMQLYSDKHKKKIENQVKLLKFKTDQWLSYSGIFDDKSILFFETQLFFPEVKDGFDIVIGNPPYIQLQSKLLQEKATLYSAMGYTVFDKTGDIYCLFYERGFNLLKERGHLCYITSNKWMRSNYGETLRTYMAENTLSKILIDFGNYNAFESATVNTNILLAQKSKPGLSQGKACTLNEEYQKGDSISEFFTNHYIPMPTFGGGSWIISDNAEQMLKAKIEHIGTPLKDWDVSINYGIKTGLNDAFIISGSIKDDLIASDPSSAEIIKPILRGCDIKRYKTEYEDLWLIFIPWHFPLHKDPMIKGASNEAEKEFFKLHPIVYKHLLRFKDKLADRNKAETGIRYEWYALQRCAATYYEEFEKNMIVWGNLALSSQFAIAEKGTFINAPSTMITPANEYLLSVLNSKLGDYYIRKLGVTRNGGYFEYKPIFVEKLPVPIIPSIEQKPFENLVELILTCKQKSENAQTLEDRIDIMDYKLYELTYSEARLIDPDLDSVLASLGLSEKDYERMSIKELSELEVL